MKNNKFVKVLIITELENALNYYKHSLKYYWFFPIVFFNGCHKGFSYYFSYTKLKDLILEELKKDYKGNITNKFWYKRYYFFNKEPLVKRIEHLERTLQRLKPLNK